MLARRQMHARFIISARAKGVRRDRAHRHERDAARRSVDRAPQFVHAAHAARRRPRKDAPRQYDSASPGNRAPSRRPRSARRRHAARRRVRRTCARTSRCGFRTAEHCRATSTCPSHLDTPAPMPIVGIDSSRETSAPNRTGMPSRMIEATALLELLRLAHESLLIGFAARLHSCSRRNASTDCGVGRGGSITGWPRRCAARPDAFAALELDRVRRPLPASNRPALRARPARHSPGTT